MAGELRERGSELPEAANKSLDGESVLPLRAPSLLRNNFDGSHVVPSLREIRLSLPQTCGLAPTDPQETQLCAAFNCAWRV